MMRMFVFALLTIVPMPCSVQPSPTTCTVDSSTLSTLSFDLGTDAQAAPHETTPQAVAAAKTVLLAEHSGKQFVPKSDYEGARLSTDGASVTFRPAPGSDRSTLVYKCASEGATIAISFFQNTSTEHKKGVQAGWYVQCEQPAADKSESTNADSH